MERIDPDWAWSPFENGATAWSRSQVTHLYRRAGFGASQNLIEEALSSTPQEIVQSLVRTRPESDAYQSEINSLATTILATSDIQNLPAWWAYRFLTSNDPLREKATLFWHGHFATSGEKVTDPRLMYKQNESLREHALNSFREMVHAIAQDPAMLIYLDSATNRKAHPNENFARELMELFCLGEGRYTETDIRELSRCFTGWEIRSNRFRFNRYQHDSQEKSFLGQTGTFSGEEGIDIVLAQSSLPYFITGKLVTFFVTDEQVPTIELLKPLADQFVESGLQIGPVIETILTSNLFYSKFSIAAKVRSPVDFAVGFLRSLDATTDLYALTAGLQELGQTPFFPPNVKGWDGGRAWINSSTLLARANLIHQILNRKETRFSQTTLDDMLSQHNLRTGTEIVGWWEDQLFAAKPPREVSSQIARQIESRKGNREQRLRGALHMLCTLPEFQLC